MDKVIHFINGSLHLPAKLVIAPSTTKSAKNEAQMMELEKTIKPLS